MIIGLINPNREIKEPAIHLGLGYISSYVKSIHPELKVILLDTRLASEKDQRRFYEIPFDLVGITATSQTFTEALSHGLILREKYPGMPICIGGPHPSTYLDESLIDTPFDYAIIGEGEVTFSELISYLKGDLSLQDINGLLYKEKEGEIRRNPPRQLIGNIDLIPFPDYDIFEINKYPQHRIITSRGCPYKCVFCNSHSIWSRKWRSRSAENVNDEIDWILSNYAMKTFVFNDDSFNIDLKRVEKICDSLIEGNKNIIWSSSIRIDKINPEIALKMKRSGCYNLSIGIESANDQVLQRVGKKLNKEKISEGISILRKAGIDVMGQFMIGNPGDTLNTIEESIRFAKESKLNGVEFYTTLPYKDTEVWEYVNSHGKWLTDKPGYEYHTVEPRIIFETPEFSYEERLKAIDMVRAKGYYHALSTDQKDFFLDAGKQFAKIIQRISGSRSGNRIYLVLRSFYRTFFRRGTR